MEDIVARYIAEIQEVQPEGPYTVVGYCQSAYIAYEIAAKLEAMGHRNNNVIIIESSTPWYEEDIRKTQSYNLILDKYKLILIKRPLKLVRESLGQERGGRLKFITSKIAYVLGTRVKKIAGMPGNAPVYTLTGYDQIRFPNHSFSNFTGKIVIIKASIQPPLDKYDQYLGWTKIVPPQNIEMHIVNGTHKSIFFPPFVHELGEVLNRNFNN
jgi:thioesterase domain-containing protein